MPKKSVNSPTIRGKVHDANHTKKLHIRLLIYLDYPSLK